VAPDAVTAGADVAVTWTGEATSGDFVSIVTPDTPEGSYDDYKYARRAPAVVPAPVDAGDYEIRYLSARSGHPTLARRPLSVIAATASLEAPASVAAGEPYQVQWTGPDNPQDFISLVPVGTPEGKFESPYAYTKRGNPAELRAPDEPGDYELRYLMGRSPHPTIVRRAMTVTAVSATLQPVAPVAGGAKFEVAFEGPVGQGDFISFAMAGAPERDYLGYVYARSGSPAKLTAPIEAGDYELRYQTGQSYRILTRTALTVTGISATLQVPDAVSAGAQFAVVWDGPDNEADFLSIGAHNDDPRSWDNYAYTRDGSPATLKAPELPGTYRVRYQTGQDYKQLAVAEIEVLPVTASLTAPATAPARASVDVSWEGPGNDGDYVVILPVGADNGQTGHYAWVRRGPDLKIRTPEQPGAYELRYVTARKKLTLAKRALTIEPRPEPGLLRVVSADPVQALTRDGTVAVILDASGSMLQRMGDRRRIVIAKAAVTQLVQETLPDQIGFSLRVFGHKEADSCRTDLEMPVAPLDRAAAARVIESVEAMNLARTPIADSLSKTAADLAGGDGPHVIILVTDGEETCDGDPAAVIARLVASGLNVRVNIVGFAIDELMLQETFQEWARLGNGQYFNAQDADQLAASLRAAVEVPYTVFDAQGVAVATGTVNGAAIELAAGTYRITAGQQVVEAVVVEMEGKTTATLK